MEKDRLINDIKDGKIFIYPTDTIYGLGCDAHKEDSVSKIKEMKGRDKNKPLSIIAPSKKWIFENLDVDKKLIDKYLPGKYTLILKKKDKGFLKHVSSGETLGIRIPDCEFTQIVQEVDVPFITTSVNLSGEPFITQISEIGEKIKDKVDNIVDIGKLDGSPSTIVFWNRRILKR